MHHWSTFVLYVPSAFKIEIRLLDLISTLKHKEVGCVTPPTTAKKKLLHQQPVAAISTSSTWVQSLP